MLTSAFLSVFHLSWRVNYFHYQEWPGKFKHGFGQTRQQASTIFENNAAVRFMGGNGFLPSNTFTSWWPCASGPLQTATGPESRRLGHNKPNLTSLIHCQRISESIQPTGKATAQEIRVKLCFPQGDSAKHAMLCLQRGDTEGERCASECAYASVCAHI